MNKIIIKKKKNYTELSIIDEINKNIIFFLSTKEDILNKLTINKCLCNTYYSNIKKMNKKITIKTNLDESINQSKNKLLQYFIHYFFYIIKNHYGITIFKLNNKNKKLLLKYL